MKTFYRYIELLKKCFAVILSCIFIGFIIYYSSSRILIKVVEYSLLELARQGADIVDMELKNHLKILETIAKKSIIANPSIDINEKLEILKGYNGDSKLLRIGKYMAYTPVKGTTWSIAVTAPKQEVLGGVNRILNILLLSLAALSLAFIMINTYFYYLKKHIKKHQMMSQNAIDVANIVIIKFDLNGHLTDFNNHAKIKLGYTDSMIGEKSIFDLLDSQNARIMDSIITDFQNGIVEKDFELALLASDSKTVHFLFNINNVFDLNEKKADEIELMGIDLTERVKGEKLLQEKHEELIAVYEKLTASEEELKQQLGEIIEHQQKLCESEERLALVVDASGIGIWDFNTVNNDLFFSSRWKEIMGFERDTPPEVLRGWKERIHPEDISVAVNTLNDYLSGKIPNYVMQYRIKNDEGGYNWVRSVCKALWDSNGCALRIAGAHTDITQEKMDEYKITRLAYFDSLTGLYNKASVRDKFSELMDLDFKKVALLFMDLDNFKLTNDSYGHAVGDQLLVQVADTLMEISKDSSIVSRLGGDEFVILTKDYENHKELEEIAEKLVSHLDNVFIVGNYNINVSSSIGIAIYPFDASSFDELLKNADTAMYKAKEKGKNRYEFYNPSMNEAIYEKLNLQSYMRKAISDGEFILYYQPFFTADDRKLVGFEALLRWTSPEMGDISPAKFIPVAEETRLILPIGDWVIRTACCFLKRLHELIGTGLSMSINISILQFQQPDFAQRVLEILELNNLPPESLELEITEMVLIQNINEVSDNIALLKSRGIKIALDDFDTGYSLLNYLTQLPINTLKIDKSFIQRIGKADDNKLIVGSIIFISKKMGLTTVAEGVETTGQLDYLKKMNCDIIQGFLLGKPQPGEQTLELVKKVIKGNDVDKTGV